MAELEKSCCSAEAQQSCCDPSEKDACCGDQRRDGCGCVAGGTPPAGGETPADDVR
jgi:hypothetical protein